MQSIKGSEDKNKNSNMKRIKIVTWKEELDQSDMILFIIAINFLEKWGAWERTEDCWETIQNSVTADKQPTIREQSRKYTGNNNAEGENEPLWQWIRNFYVAWHRNYLRNTQQFDHKKHICQKKCANVNNEIHSELQGTGVEQQ